MEFLSQINPVDAIVVVVLLVSGVLALMRGFVAEVLTIIGFVAAIAASLYGTPALLPTVEQYVDKGTLARAVAVAILFFGTLFTASIITFFISGRLHKTKLSALDRSFGFLFGALRGLLIVSLLYIATTYVVGSPYDEKSAESSGKLVQLLRDAHTTPLLDSTSNLILSLAPDKGLSIEDLTKADPVRDLVQPQVERVQDAAKSVREKGYTMPSRDDINKLIDSAGDGQ